MGDGAMSDAPERIWAWPKFDDKLSDSVDEWGWVYGDWDRCDAFEFKGAQYVRADLHTAALARAERAEAELAKLADPNAVHVSMLAGTVAKPSWDQIKHIYAREAERAEALLKEVVEAMKDACSAVDYVRFHYGELYGVGFARVRDKHDAIIARIQGDSHE